MSVIVVDARAPDPGATRSTWDTEPPEEYPPRSQEWYLRRSRTDYAQRRRHGMDPPLAGRNCASR